MCVAGEGPCGLEGRAETPGAEPREAVRDRRAHARYGIRVEDGHEGDGGDRDGGSASGGAAAQQGEQPAAAVASRGRQDNRKFSGKPGRGKGAPGHSRTQVLPIDAEQVQAPGYCAARGRTLEDGDEARAHAAHDTLDLSRPDDGAGGLVLH